MGTVRKSMVEEARVAGVEHVARGDSRWESIDEMIELS